MSAELSPEDLSLAEAMSTPDVVVAPKTGSQQTARRAVAILIGKQQGFHEPTATERSALLVGFAKRRKVLYGAAFDIVRMTGVIDLSDPDDIARNMARLTIFEIKSTNRPTIGPDLKNYFFALSTAELLVAQSLGEQFRFAFVNTVTGEHIEMSLREVFARARGIYPTWSIRF